MRYISAHPTVKDAESKIRRFQVRKLGFSGDEELRDLNLEAWQGMVDSGHQRDRLSDLVARLRASTRKHSDKKPAVRAM